MKNLLHLFVFAFLFVAIGALTPTVYAQAEDMTALADEVVEGVEQPAEVADADEPEEPRFAVFLPEQIDRVWFWFYYTDQQQHIVQSAVEKALIREGFDVVDVRSANAIAGSSINDILSKDRAVATASELGADYVIVGTAIADKKSQGSAYGVTVVRASAEITAKIVRVSDAKIMDVEDASAEEGGEALQAASRQALKKAGRDIARKIARSAKKITSME